MPNKKSNKTGSSSYSAVFSQLDDEFLDIVEKRNIEIIKSEYDKNHIHKLQDFVDLINKKPAICPYCSTVKHKIKDYDSNGVIRYQCKNKKCNKTYNALTNTLFFSSKINLTAWYSFLESLLGETSIKAACIKAKISFNTGHKWAKKIFFTIKDYQDNIQLKKRVYYDETFVHVDTSDIEYVLNKNNEKKQKRGVSKNKICIAVATDKSKIVAEIIGRGFPTKKGNLEFCKKHVQRNSTLVSDDDNSLQLASIELSLTREIYKSKTPEAFEALKPVDDLCNYLKFFLDKHRGFKKNKLQDYINLFVFITNEKFIDQNLFYRVSKLLKMMLEMPKMPDEDD